MELRKKSFVYPNIVYNRSCDVGGESHDHQLGGSRDKGSESHDHEEWVCQGGETTVEGGRGEVEGRAVERWCDWGGGEGEKEEGELERVLYFLRLTAELCHLTCQVRLVLHGTFVQTTTKNSCFIY